MGRMTSSICDCVHALKAKQLELSTPNFAYIMGHSG